MSMLLTPSHLQEVTGGLSFGQVLSTLAIGFVTGGPAGLGIAASGLVMAKGIDNLNDVLKNP